MQPGVMIILIFLLVGAGITGLAVYAFITEKKRGEQTAQFASSLGLIFEPKLNAEDHQRLDHMPLANRGRSKQATNAVVADAGDLRMAVFDYSYTTGSGKSRRTVTQSTVLARSQQLRMPDFSLAPETFLHKLGEFFGMDDIDFEDDPAFSQKFLLKGDNEQAVRGFFTRERRQAFMDFDRVTIEGSGDTFVFYRPGQRHAVSELKQLMEEAYQVQERLS